MANCWWMPELRMAASEPKDSIVERLNAWQPEVLIAYASMMRILADEQLAGRLQIVPRAVFTSSEVLTKQTRRRIVQAWGERLFNQYAATESGSLAAECNRHRGMHLMARTSVSGPWFIARRFTSIMRISMSCLSRGCDRCMTRWWQKRSMCRPARSR